MQTLLNDQLLQTTVLVPHLPQSLNLVYVHAAKLLLLRVGRRSPDPVRTANIRCLQPSVILLPYPGDLLFAQSTLLQHVRPLKEPTRELHFQLVEFSGSKSWGTIRFLNQPQPEPRQRSALPSRLPNPAGRPRNACTLLETSRYLGQSPIAGWQECLQKERNANALVTTVPIAQAYISIAEAVSSLGLPSSAEPAAKTTVAVRPICYQHCSVVRHPLNYGYSRTPLKVPVIGDVDRSYPPRPFHL